MPAAFRVLVCLLLAWLVSPAWAADSGPCRPATSAGASYVVCTVDLRRDAIRLFWAAPDGTPYAGLSRLKDSAAGRGLVMAMNAGMYAVDLSPLGLYVENGRLLKRANTADGAGNFHLKPNGVFYVSGQSAGILETRAYLRRKPKAEFATQSGPMLVIDGRLHPKFSDEGPSRKIRNGVGTHDAHTVIFAISNEPVSFGAFARLFRDDLGCANALFLDGSISSLYAPGLGRQDVALKPLGPLVGVESRERRSR